MDSPDFTTTPIQGYISLHVKQRQVLNVFVHLTGLPKEGEFMLHVPASAVLIRTLKEFQDAHPQNGDESRISPYKMVFDLGDKTIHALLVMERTS